MEPTFSRPGDENLPDFSAQSVEPTAAAVKFPPELLSRWPGETNLELLDRKRQMLAFAAQASSLRAIAELLTNPEALLSRRQELIDKIPDPLSERSRYVESNLSSIILEHLVAAVPIYFMNTFTLNNFYTQVSTEAVGGIAFWMTAGTIIASILYSVRRIPRERADLLQELRQNAPRLMNDDESYALETIESCFAAENLSLENFKAGQEINERVKARIADAREEIEFEAKDQEQAFFTFFGVQPEHEEALIDRQLGQ